MAFKDNVKEWFKTGLKPTQAQFWAQFDWLRWKDESVPVADVEGLQEVLDEKTDVDLFNAHLTDENAHFELRDRNSHTGTQDISTVSGLEIALESKANDADVVHQEGSEEINGTKKLVLNPILVDDWYVAVGGALEFVNNLLSESVTPSININNNVEGVGININNESQSRGINIEHNSFDNAININNNGPGIAINVLANIGTGIQVVSNSADTAMVSVNSAPFGVASVVLSNDGTAINASSDTGIAIEAVSNSGTAIIANSETSAAIIANSESNFAILANSTSGKAIKAVSQQDDAIEATSVDGNAVNASSENGNGVLGYSATVAGVQGTSRDWIGVKATSVNYSPLVAEIPNSSNESDIFQAKKDNVIQSKISHDGKVTANQYLVSSLNTAPSSSTDIGTTGEIRYTSTGIYWCIDTDSWIKVTGTNF